LKNRFNEILGKQERIELNNKVFGVIDEAGKNGSTLIVAL